jgi:hypothetical protein
MGGRLAVPAPGAQARPPLAAAGLSALAILAVATVPLTLIVGIAASTAALVPVAIADTVREGDQAPSTSA